MNVTLKWWNEQLLVMRAKESQFETDSRTFRADLARFGASKRKSVDDLRVFEKKLRDLNKIITEMQDLFQKSKDRKDSILKYKQDFSSLSLMLKEANKKYQEEERNKLFGVQASTINTKLSDQQLMTRGLTGFKGVVKDAVEMDNQLTVNINQLHEDDVTMDKMNEDMKEIDNDADVTNRLMKRQRNQELLKKLMLVALAAFLTVFNVVVLVIKIT